MLQLRISRHLFEHQKSLAAFLQHSFAPKRYLEMADGLVNYDDAYRSQKGCSWARPCQHTGLYREDSLKMDPVRYIVFLRSRF